MFRPPFGVDFCVLYEARSSFIFPCGEPIVSALILLIHSPRTHVQPHICHRLAVSLRVGLFLASLCHPTGLRYIFLI